MFLGSSQGSITDIRFAIEFAKFSPRIMEKWKEGGGLYERERESSDLVLLKFGSIVFWEVGYVPLFRDSRMSYTDI